MSNVNSTDCSRIKNKSILLSWVCGLQKEKSSSQPEMINYLGGIISKINIKKQFYYLLKEEITRTDTCVHNVEVSGVKTGTKETRISTDGIHIYCHEFPK